MPDTTARALALLNLLQTHRHWTGPDLARRLGVTRRTVRRDVERLRDLGYRIESAPGLAGGYRLEPGGVVPPLLLTDDEAVAMAAGLRLAATRQLTDGADTTLRALTKLERVLPAALRERVNALATAVRPSRTGPRTGAGPGTEAASSARPGVSPTVLTDLALACRDHERTRFTHISPSASGPSPRHVEPHHLAPSERHWYLLCWDLDRDDWRTFRIDRISAVHRTAVFFEPRPLSQRQIEEFVAVATSWGRQATDATATIRMPIERLRQEFGEWAQGVEPAGADTTRWPVGGGDVRETMYALSWIPAGVEYTVDLPGPARTQLRETLARMLRALETPPDAA